VTLTVNCDSGVGSVWATVMDTEVPERLTAGTPLPLVLPLLPVPLDPPDPVVPPEPLVPVPVPVAPPVPAAAPLSAPPPPPQEAMHTTIRKVTAARVIAGKRAPLASTAGRDFKWLPRSICSYSNPKIIPQDADGCRALFRELAALFERFCGPVFSAPPADQSRLRNRWSPQATGCRPDLILA